MTDEAEQSQPRRMPRVVHPRVEMSESTPGPQPRSSDMPLIEPAVQAQPRPEPRVRHGELRQVDVVQGAHPGDRYARVKRWRDFQRVKAGHLRLGSGAG